MIKRYLSDDTNIAIPKRSGRELACLAEYQVFTRIFLLNVFLFPRINGVGIMILSIKTHTTFPKVASAETAKHKFSEASCYGNTMPLLPLYNWLQCQHGCYCYWQQLVTNVIMICLHCNHHGNIKCIPV